MLCIKISKYNPYGTDNDDRYTYVCDLLAQRVDPPSLDPHSLVCAGKTVYVSPLRRACECIDGPFQVLPELAELAFDVSRYCDRDTFLREGSTAVRRAFLQSFVENTLSFSHNELVTHFATLRELTLRESESVFVSHTFLLITLKLYMETDGMLFTQPESIFKYLDPRQHFLEFGTIMRL